MGETMKELQEQLDDFAVLAYCRGEFGKYNNMSPMQRQIYFQVLGRVEDRGEVLFQREQIRREHEALAKKVTCMELMHPFLKD